MEAFGRALAINPKLAIAYVERGSANMQHGRIAQALADYDQAIELDPKQLANGRWAAAILSAGHMRAMWGFFRETFAGP